jgi:hypothetical protein
MLSIIGQLRESVFEDSSFVSKLASNREYLRACFQTPVSTGLNYHNQFPCLDAEIGKNYESLFLSAFAEEMHRKLPKYRLFVSVDMIINDQPEMRDSSKFGVQLDDIRSVICNPDRNLPRGEDPCFWKIEDDQRVPSFHSSKCFEGRKWKTEIDAIVSTDTGNLCFIEYEEKLVATCNNFMKMHRLRRGAPNRQLESLFILRLSDRGKDSLLDRFDRYVTRASSMLDTLLGKNWSVLILVNLLSGAPKLLWYPKKVP